MQNQTWSVLRAGECFSNHERNYLSEKIFNNFTEAYESLEHIKSIEILPGDTDVNTNPITIVGNHIGVALWSVPHMFKFAYERVMANRYTKQDEDSLTRCIVFCCPDCTTAWNKRKIFLSKETNFLNLDKELNLTRLVIMQRPKSSETFAHRRWILLKILKLRDILQYQCTKIPPSSDSDIQRNTIQSNDDFSTEQKLTSTDIPIGTSKIIPEDLYVKTPPPNGSDIEHSSIQSNADFYAEQKLYPTNSTSSITENLCTKIPPTSGSDSQHDSIQCDGSSEQKQSNNNMECSDIHAEDELAKAPTNDKSKIPKCTKNNFRPSAQPISTPSNNIKEIQIFNTNSDGLNTNNSEFGPCTRDCKKHKKRDLPTFLELVKCEFLLCKLAGERQKSNYSAWAHRAWVVDNIIVNTAENISNSMEVLKCSCREVKATLFDNIVEFMFAEMIEMRRFTEKHISDISILTAALHIQSRYTFLYCRQFPFSKVQFDHICKIWVDSLHHNATLLKLYDTHKALWCHRRNLIIYFHKLKFIRHNIGVESYALKTAREEFSFAKEVAFCQHFCKRLPKTSGVMMQNFYCELLGENENLYSHRHCLFIKKCLK